MSSKSLYLFAALFALSKSGKSMMFTSISSSLIFKAFCGYLQLRFISKREFTIGKTLLNSYLKQPFVWYLNKNTTQLSKNIINEVNQD
jgi:hypothetical protein